MLEKEGDKVEGKGKIMKCQKRKETNRGEGGKRREILPRENPLYFQVLSYR